MSGSTDPIVLGSVGADSFRGFFEPVEVVHFGDQIGLCTGVQGMTVYRAADPCCLSLEARIEPSLTRRYARCQHLAVEGNHLFLSNHGDELAPQPFITALDISRGFVEATTIDTIERDGTLFEGIATAPGVLYAAQHEDGLAVFRIEGNGRPILVTEVAIGLENAWKPILDPAGAFIYVADAQGGVAVFDAADPLMPRFLAKAPTGGTVKDLAVLGDYVYAAAGTAGVEVFDVRDPANIARTTTLDTPGSALGIAAEGRYLAVADWNDVQVYRLDDPGTPVRIGHQKAYLGSRPTPSPLGRVLDVDLHDGVIYMAEWQGPQAHRIIDEVAAPDVFVAATLELPRTAAGVVSSAGLFVQNLGERPLSVDEVTIEAPFTVSLSGANPIDPDRAALLEVVYEAPDTQPATATLSIRTNDPDEPVSSILVQVNQPGLRSGDPAPDLSFTDLNGFTHTLAAQRGKPVLLAYFATF